MSVAPSQIWWPRPMVRRHTVTTYTCADRSRLFVTTASQSPEDNTNHERDDGGGGGGVPDGKHFNIENKQV